MQFVNVNANVRKGTVITASSTAKTPRVKKEKTAVKPKYDISYRTIMRADVTTKVKSPKAVFIFSRKFMETLGVGSGTGFAPQTPANADLTTNTALRLVKVSSDTKGTKFFGGAKAKEGAKVSNFFSSNVVEETLCNSGLIVKGVDSNITLISTSDENGTYYTFAPSGVTSNFVVEVESAVTVDVDADDDL